MFQHEHSSIFPEFVAHEICWLQRPDIIASHAIGGALIAAAYYLIPFLLLYATRKYRFDRRLTFIFAVYATFIFLCGTTHLFDVVMIWKISEGFLMIDGWLRVVTGVFSLFSAGVTVWALQIFLTLVSQIFTASAKLRQERARLGRATDETIAQWNAVMDEAAAHLQQKI